MAARVLRGRSLLSSYLRGCSDLYHSQGVCQSSNAEQLGPGFRTLQQALATAWARCYACLPDHTELQMPALSPTMAQGNVNSWEVKEGDVLEAGTIIATIETDKATLEWENQDDGFLAKILVQAGAKDIAVGTPLAIVVENADDVDSFKDYQGSSKASTEKSAEKSETSTSGSQPPAAEKEANSQAAESTSHRSRDGIERIGPAARLLLHQHHLSNSDVKGTGPFGIITKADVLEALERGVKPSHQQTSHQADASSQAKETNQKQKSSQPAASGGASSSHTEEYTDVPNSQIRKIIASRLLESKQTVPHYYVKAVAELDAVNGVRESMRSQGTKVSLNDFVVRAVALALADVPAANSMWDGKAQEIRQLDSVDVAIAVATDKGLITPILKAANTKSLKQISEEIRELAGRARANKLKPEEFQGGTFTISNLGMFGIDSFSAIINPPQAGILAVGGTQHKVVLEDGKPVSVAQMNVVLSADQRVFDGTTSSKFLSALCSNLANPVKLIV